MEINVHQLRKSVQWFVQHVPPTAHVEKSQIKFLQRFTNSQEITETDVSTLLTTLCAVLQRGTECTELIAFAFRNVLPLILSQAFGDDSSTDNFNFYQRKCVALAKLVSISTEAKRFARTYFLDKLPPFGESHGKPDKKKSNLGTTESPVDDLSLLKCCYQLLRADADHYRVLWNWMPFIEEFVIKMGHDTRMESERLYCNHIVALLTNMSLAQLNKLNENISAETLIQFEKDQTNDVSNLHMPSLQTLHDVAAAESTITYNFQSDSLISVEGVFLPIFDSENYNFYKARAGGYDDIVKVDSCKANLRSIALGVAAGKPVCLSGPVGCGKTTLVEYLARKTGRIAPKEEELKRADNDAPLKQNGKENKAENKIGNERSSKTGRKRVYDLKENGYNGLGESNPDINVKKNGFLRIQLGDQTDSKMLLGQYRCTDVPGQFIWLPGILTQAVMDGCWLLLEDLDCAPTDVFAILSQLFENNSLSVPGYRDCLKISVGFQLFITVRTNRSSNVSQKSLCSLISKHLYTVNILPLSRNELCKIISTNYPKLSTVANRIVDVFLTFSSGDHDAADNLREQEIDDKADKAEKYLALPHEKVSLSTIPNAGRLVSTRDLIKLCKRSDPVFSVTSAECAYFVFQNAVDVFCSNLPQGKEKTRLVTSIGAKLGIIQSRCIALAEEYKPDVQVDKTRLKVGRALLSVRTVDQDDCDETINVAGSDDDGGDCDEEPELKRRKLNTKNASLVAQNTLRQSANSATFSFTRLATCLLERVAVCVSHAEPVLLVGETGVGKTSAVQYLAERTHHNLVVVNMNNQSDVSDLIGGYKPVDLNYVLTPLRLEFETLFRGTYDQAKNESFLRKLSVCFNQGSYSVIVSLMVTVTNAFFKRHAENALDSKGSMLLPQWQAFKVKLSKLSAQLAKSLNISFAFIAGSLVNCITRGDWLLLDEINLATTETLECLSTILEPDGSVVLLEKGDFTPVRRHPDFRIFACMNPNTDIGKKDLPTGIRNRFTEFFVDELSTDADLTLLISDYLANTGIQRKNVVSIVRLYKKLRDLAKLELNDGLGNRPVYSLRTLCRALRICAKNLCGSVERNLYESFCMSFLTQLDADSHSKVLQLIKAALLSNEKAVLGQGIPRPQGQYLNFEGYWVQQGTRDVQECESYILTPSVKANLKDLARIISIGKLPILLQGPTSAGKTSLIDFIARRSGNHCLRINNHEHTDLQEYIGTYVADATGKLSFKEGVLVQAMRHGSWIILDELNLASTEILEALNRVLDDNRELFIPETQTIVRAHQNFMLFATQNPPGLYGGRKTLSRAFKNRFIELHFSEIPRAELEVILEKRCLMPPTFAKKMVMCMADLQKHRATTAKNVFTLRDLFRWGNRYTFADKRLLADNSYDWNQHLVEEGYLVLSAKVRTDVEIRIIEDALYRNFKKRIDLQRLFEVSSLDQGTSSAVTCDILRTLKAFKLRDDIVWTRNMARTAVLSAKALQFDEPVLLVGPTGCGKTTICQVLASIQGVRLRILNCHMHTEGADFLGGLRPCRQADDDERNAGEASERRKLFEWADGPLIRAMQEGSYFMADEISLAEDSVLERLNCILEPERTVLLAEKGGIAGDDSAANLESEFVVQARPGFQFLATMNPGGDFGKKELSPALRNRFTEIWCLPSDANEDLVRIARNAIEAHDDVESARLSYPLSLKLAEYVVEIVSHIRAKVDKFKFSVRDILAWAEYVCKNRNMKLEERIVFGLETIFLDALEMLPFESLETIDALRENILEFAAATAQRLLTISFDFDDLQRTRQNQTVCRRDGQFGIPPFLLATKTSSAANDGLVSSDDFSFNAPTTLKNVFRLLSALTLHKPILLEGPPGVGKTTTVESLAKATGHRVVRINLCEHTDLSDLFGTDLPAEDEILTQNAEQGQSANLAAGSFVWRDGPLLAALKTADTWILLDELNLAPQSVLEGLNAIFDHRGEAYIPELNKTFKLDKATRFFACQNPLKQGGGRKGLPQSFLNRFTKVYLRKLTSADLMFVINEKYGPEFEHIKKRICQSLHHLNLGPCNVFDVHRNWKTEGRSPRLSDKECVLRTEEEKLQFDLAERIVKFSDHLDDGVAKMEFGYKGGPYEINLRDILRWCDFLLSACTAADTKQVNLVCFKQLFDDFLLKLYESMKTVYYLRMRCEQDKQYIRRAFGLIFNCDAENLHGLSEDVSIYWTNDKVYVNDLVVNRSLIPISEGSSALDSVAERALERPNQSPLLLASQRTMLYQMVKSLQHAKPVLLCGAANCGKTKLIESVCAISGQAFETDTIDDSVAGSFQQVDLNRHLECCSRTVESIFFHYIQDQVMAQRMSAFDLGVWNAWSFYSRNNDQSTSFVNSLVSTEGSPEVLLFRKRLRNLQNIIVALLKVGTALGEVHVKHLEATRDRLSSLDRKLHGAETLNMGGSFEWVDSKIVQSLKTGQCITLEHANLCSSAVLDRLNPVFEPNGSLLIAEKGVIDSDSAEVVRKSENFRAFLTIDPRNGELSRAMRNRCVELAVAAEDAYGVDDMRQLIYANGVHDINAINVLLEMHRAICALTEAQSYSVTHLIQCAFLVASYNGLGYTLNRAIYVSGMEVYVYSAHTDLLGYGLSYYQNKLRDIVLHTIENHETLPIPGSYLEELALRCADLSDMKRIRLQTLPLKLLLTHHSEAFKYLGQLVEGFRMYDFSSVDAEALKLYCIYSAFFAASFADLNLRHLYLRDLIQQTTGDKAGLLAYRALKLFNAVDDFKRKCGEHLAHKGLPWNDKAFPRLLSFVEYSGSYSRTNIWRLNASLIFQLLINDVPSSQTTSEVQKMNALDYCYAIDEKQVHDKENIVQLRLLSAALKEFHNCLQSTLQKRQSAQLADLSKAMLCSLWLNRLIAVSQEPLFARGRMNQNLLHKITQHFIWLRASMLDQLLSSRAADDVDAALEKQIRSRIECFEALFSVKKEICMLQDAYNELYNKHFIEFRPFYDEKEIQMFHCAEQAALLFDLVGFHQAARQQGSSEMLWKLRAQTTELRRTVFRALKTQDDLNMSFPSELQDADARQYKAVLGELHPPADCCDEDNANTNVSGSELKRSLEQLAAEHQHFKRTQHDAPFEHMISFESCCEFVLLPMREYFLTRALTREMLKLLSSSQEVLATSSSLQLNTAFCDATTSLGCNALQLTNVLLQPSSRQHIQGTGIFLRHINALLGSNVDAASADGALLSVSKAVKPANALNATLTHKLQQLEQYSLSRHSGKVVRAVFCRVASMDDSMTAFTEVPSMSEDSGSQLLNCVFSVIRQDAATGHNAYRLVPIEDVESWRLLLDKLQQLLWQNCLIVTRKYSALLEGFRHADAALQKLKTEVSSIRGRATEGSPLALLEQAGDPTLELAPYCSQIVERIEASNGGRQTELDTFDYQLLRLQTALINVHTGLMKLRLYVFMPLIDPAEKQRLIKQYLAEDISCHRHMLTAFDVMRLILEYKNFASEIHASFEEQLALLEAKQSQQRQRVPLRPSGECLYLRLKADVMHYLHTNCDVVQLTGLVSSIKDFWRKSTETLTHGVPSAEEKTLVDQCTVFIDRLNLWSLNAEQFLNEKLKPYRAYYQDLVRPLTYAVSQISHGFHGLKSVLCHQRSVMLLPRPRADDVVCETYKMLINRLNTKLGDLAEYPNTMEMLRPGSLDLDTGISVRLLRMHLNETSLRIHFSGCLDEESFQIFDSVLKHYNIRWQSDEDERRRKKAEDESLYVQKVKCAETSEEQLEAEEIDEYFPTNVHADFGEFVVPETLEKLNKPAASKPKEQESSSDELTPDHCQFLVESFMQLMEQYAACATHYKPCSDRSDKTGPTRAQLLAAAESRLDHFINEYLEKQDCLTDLLSESSYNGLCLVVGLQQARLSDHRQSSGNAHKQPKPTSDYNYYKDSNIGEVICCLQVLQGIEARVSKELELYPDHATLQDILKVIKRIRQLPAAAPVVRFNAGLQILRQKLAQWNEVAHKENHLRAEEVKIADLVQAWMRLELQCWRNCLSQTEIQVEGRAYRYWFFIYNLLREFMAENQVDRSFTDIKTMEKRFAQQEVMNEGDSKSKTLLGTSDIIGLLKQFIEAASYGDFQLRMRLLQCFELYLHYKNTEHQERLGHLIAGLHNLQLYYAQFAHELLEAKHCMRAPIEKKLKELVKIESYNKDLSYFSMRNNVARVHRNLNKFLKEYRLLLEQKITAVFQPKDATTKDYNVGEVKGNKELRFVSKVKYNMLDCKHFLAPAKLMEHYQFQMPTSGALEGSLLKRVNQLYATSRNVVKEAIMQRNSSRIIASLDVVFTEQLERCEQLRSLSVDRSKERPKQILEAKQILQQKRKGLSDLFKILTQLGLSFKSGLLELSLGTECIDYTLPPFDVDCMIAATVRSSSKENKHLTSNFMRLNENLHRYFMKSVFKLQLLRNVMLTPLSELGPPNIERIKGFAIDFFLLVEQQRLLLSKSANQLFDFRLCLLQLDLMHEATKGDSIDPNRLEFSHMKAALRALKASLAYVRYVTHQFLLLLETAPSNAVSEQQVFQDADGVLAKDSPAYLRLLATATEMDQHCQALFVDVCSRGAGGNLFDADILEKYLKRYEHLAKFLQPMLQCCEVNATKDLLPLAQPLLQLMRHTQETLKRIARNSRGSANRPFDASHMQGDLENLLQSVLLALQKLYKQHDGKSAAEAAAQASDDVDDLPLELTQQHLKQLVADLRSDWSALNLQAVREQLQRILENFTNGQACPDKLSQIRHATALLPILEQYHSMALYNLNQQLGAHKVCARMLSVMLTVFIEIGTKGFCVPPDLMQDEEGQQKQENNSGEGGFGLEDGTGEQDASDKIESEDQLDDAKRPEDRKDGDKEENQKDCKEEKGIEMSEDFDGKMQDIEKPENEEDDSGDSEKEDDEDMNKEMGETEEGAEKLDDQIWGDDEDKPDEEDKNDMEEESEGKGNQDEKDAHNDLDTKNESAKNKDESQQGNEDSALDATNEANEEERKKQKPDISDMKEGDEVDDDQTNPYHNELEEPPEAEEMDLGDMNNGNENDQNEEDADAPQDTENPFDIDQMKENNDSEEPRDGAGDDDDDDKADDDKLNDSDDESDSADSEASNGDDEALRKDQTNDEENGEQEQNEEDQDVDAEPKGQERGDLEKDKPEEENSEVNNANEEDDYEPSKDKPSKEENVQSTPQTEKDKGSSDQATDQELDQEKDVTQQQKLDEQDTGEDKEGVGQAENDENEEGHQGIAETKEKVASEDPKTESAREEKRKPSRTNEERSLGDDKNNKAKQLKTVESLKKNAESSDEEDEGAEQDDEGGEADEYQHVKEPKASDKTTLDSATEEQSKQLQHKEMEEEELQQDSGDEEGAELTDVDDTEEAQQDIADDVEKLSAEKNEHQKKHEKPAKNEKPKDNRDDGATEVEVEGDVVETADVERCIETTAHCSSDIVMEKSAATEDLSATEILQMRRRYQEQMMNATVAANLPGQEQYETWQTISHRMSQNARELCEQLRLILEPTKCTRLKGDYRTGRRINMRKIIPYIASQFRKDKIWLRRTKPAQRDYKITIAIDDSKSMHHNNSKTLTLEAISLISQALTLLESGRLSVVSFGETTQIILNHTEHFDGPRLVNRLNFSQDKTRIAELLDFIRTVNSEEGNSSSENGLFENLLLILSDGRNIYSEGKTKVKNAVKSARLQRIFLVYIIIDNPENKNSILDVQTVENIPGQGISIKAYLDDFPFPYYVIVRDLNQLPIVLSEAMRQWFELVSSEQ